jgi:chemotaxis protein CheD
MNPLSRAAAAAEGAAIPVGMAEAAVTRRATDVLVAHGLGSCIALCVRDPVARVSGMAHIVLPQSHGTPAPFASQVAKFADVAVPHLLDVLEQQGASRARLAVAVVGGAQILLGADRLEIGKQNTVSVLRALKDRGLALRAHDVGGHLGRTCRLFAVNGRVLVRPIGFDERELTVLGPASSGGASR